MGENLYLDLTAKRVLGHPIVSRLVARGAVHWITILVVTIVASLSTPLAYEYLHLTPVRFWLFQNLAALGWQSIKPTDVRLVLIGNDEYWRGDLEARVPTKRDYLAKIVQALDEANARVIGLDFDLRLGDPELPAVPGDFGAMEQSYRPETDIFVNTLIDVAKRRHIVLVKTIWPSEHGHDLYMVQPDVFQLYGICLSPRSDGSWDNPGYGRFVMTPTAAKNISCGYISLPYDLQSIPGRITTDDGEHINSLALSVARAFRPSLPERIGDHISYASYISKEKFAKAHMMVPVRQLFSADPKVNEQVRKTLGGKAVIVGTQWSLLAYNRGETIDMHVTPWATLAGLISLPISSRLSWHSGIIRPCRMPCSACLNSSFRLPRQWSSRWRRIGSACPSSGPPSSRWSAYG